MVCASQNSTYLERMDQIELGVGVALALWTVLSEIRGRKRSNHCGAIHGGRVAEWFKAPDSKSGVRETVS